jgi:hypothetical protein
MMKSVINFASALLLSFCIPAHTQERKLKSPLSGLVLMGNIEFHRHDSGVPDNSLAVFMARPGVFSGVDINITWAQLQPQAGPIVTQALDDALDSVRAYNAQYSASPLAVKLRVWGGANAPNWIKNLEGPPVTIFLGRPAIPLTVGRFWSNKYKQEWWDLQRQLARKYDSEPLIREVSNSSCSSLTPEPFIFPGDVESLRNMRESGYDEKAIYTCLANTAHEYDEWRTTRIEYPFNPFRERGSGRNITDQDTTLRIMQAWRRDVGRRSIVSNYGLVSPELPQLLPIYEHMREMGSLIELQAYEPKESDWNATMLYGISVGATVIELWSTTGPDTILTTATPEQFTQWSEALKENLRRIDPRNY